MPTNIVSVSAPRQYGPNPWEAAGEVAQQGLMNVLGIYQSYQHQKRQDQQMAYERQMKSQQMAEQAEMHEAQKKQWQDAVDARQAAAETEKARLMDPNTDVNALPPDWVETKTKKGQELAGPMPDGTSPLMGLDQTVKTPKKYVQRGDYVVPLDIGGVRAAKQKRQERIDTGQAVEATPELTKQIEELGLGRFEGVVPQAVMGLYQQHMRDIQNDKNIASRERQADARLAAALNRPSATDRKAARDEEQNAMIEAIVPGDANSIPSQYRDYVIAASEGRTVVPRAGTNMNLLQQMAFRYNPDLDQGNIKARQQMMADLAKGSQTSRGGQITSLNTLAKHLGSLQDAADELGKKMYSTGSSTVNWAAQKVLPSAARGPIATYLEKANAVKEEYIRALKGASPTDTELKQFSALADPTLSPTERQAHIDALMELAAGRANAQEEAYQQAFRTPSATSKSPMFGGGWAWDGGMWRLRKKGEKPGKTTPGAAPASGVSDSLGVR